MSKPQSLTQQASRGAFWALAGNITVSAISFVGTAILARILEPKDFGLIGMAVLITGFIGLFGSFGMDAALIYKKEIDGEYLSTAFWVNLLAGVGLALITFFIAPFMEVFFKQPEVKWIAMCLSLNFILTALSSIHNTLLRKAIKLREIAFVCVGGRMTRVLIMLFCALNGFSFWSIVMGVIAERVFVLISFLFIVKWRPLFIFSIIKSKELFHFGRNIYGQAFLNYLNQNMDFILTGRFLGAGQLGFYQFSYNLPYLVKGYIEDSVAPVAFPVLSKVQDDKERVVRGFLKAVRFISLITFPLMAGACFCANDFISLCYGDKWLPAANPMKVLCISAALASVNTVVSPLFNSQGRPDIGLKCGTVRILLTIISLIIGIKLGGMLGVAYGMLFVECLFTFQPLIVSKLIGLPFMQYLKSLYPAFVSTMAMVGILYLLFQSFIYSRVPIFNLLSSFVVGGFVYCFTNVLFFKESTTEFVTLFMALFKKSSTSLTKSDV